MSDDNDTVENEGEGIKNLRKQYEATAKENAEMRKQLDEFNKSRRQETVAGLLKAKGVPISAASFYTDDDVSEDAVGKWVEAHADVFQVKTDDTNDEDDANTQNAQRVTQNSFGAVQNNVTPGKIHDPVEALRLIESGMPYEELEKLGLVAPKSKMWGAKK